jgi:hypothetical protein
MRPNLACRQGLSQGHVILQLMRIALTGYSNSSLSIPRWRRQAFSRVWPVIIRKIIDTT